MADLVLTKRAQEDVGGLSRPIQRAVVETLTLLEVDPKTVGKALRGHLSGLWSCRVGNYQILYTIESRRAKTRVIVRAMRASSHASSSPLSRPLSAPSLRGSVSGRRRASRMARSLTWTYVQLVPVDRAPACGPHIARAMEGLCAAMHAVMDC